MRETFNHVQTPNSLWFSLLADLYLYTFVLLFMYVVLNVLIAITEEVFFHASQKHSAGKQLSSRLAVLLQRLDDSPRAIAK